MSLRTAWLIGSLAVIALASSALATGYRHPRNPVPEPTTMAALALGAGWAVSKLRKRGR